MTRFTGGGSAGHGRRSVPSVQASGAVWVLVIRKLTKGRHLENTNWFVFILQCF
jgi:hypothetical protein